MIPKTHLRLIIGLWLGMAAISIVAFTFLPDRAPVHWNVHGEPDRYGSRWEVAFGVPFGTALIVALMLLLPRLGPFRGNFARFAVTYGRILATILLLLLTIQLMLLAPALGVFLPVPTVTMVAVGVLFVVLGNWMSKIRRNFWIGIRTPWTLANETVWERTHRLGGRLFMILGFGLVVVSILAGPVYALAWLLGGLSFIVIWSVAYSLWLYRKLGSVDDMRIAE